jgi:hypothetical protein
VQEPVLAARRGCCGWKGSTLFDELLVEGASQAKALRMRQAPLVQGNEVPIL